MIRRSADDDRIREGLNQAMRQQPEPEAEPVPEHEPPPERRRGPRGQPAGDIDAGKGRGAPDEPVSLGSRLNAALRER